ncbi:hypothetical protein FACS1894216_18600 [Synergistales bacterium]|nr:hypothetical protein FACS1894216_18600 [Synergistales bacterium]
MSLHTVSGRPDAGGKFSKRWAKGTYGGVFVITNGIDCRQGHGRVIVCEGIATALSLYEMFAEFDTDVTVLAAMDCSNLKKQLPIIREVFGGRELIAALDDDDAGRLVGEEARRLGFSVVEPTGGDRHGS